MPEGQVLEFDRVTKRFNAVTAVSDLSVRVEPGAVTGFLGPNGAGKTTSLRMLLGQIRPTSGTATIGGSAYSELRNPLRSIGAVLEEAAYRPRRTAARQLTIAAKANGIPLSRVDEVLHLVGLQDDADTRLGSYSLGMRQRLAVGSALLGDPGVLVLDEPANGLDPEGIRWMRLLMRRMADEGRTVLVSSHVLSEIEQVADNVVVLSKGRAVFAGPIETLEDPKGAAVVVDADNRAHLITALSAAKLNFDVLRSGVTVRSSDAKTVGAVAAAAGVPLTLLQQRGPSLEDVFLDLVYGRAGGPQLAEAANPVAHADQGADAAGADAAGAGAAGAGVAGADAAGADAAAAGTVAAGGALAGVATAAATADAVPDAADAEDESSGAEDAGGGVDATSEQEETAEAGDQEETAEAPQGQASTDEAPAEETSGEETPVEDAPVEELAEEAAADRAPADENPADSSLSEEPAEETPAEEQAPEETSADEAPADEASADEAPATGAAPEDAPADESPAATRLQDAASALWAPRPAAEPAPEAEAPADDRPSAEQDAAEQGAAEQGAEPDASGQDADASEQAGDASEQDTDADASAQDAGGILPHATSSVSIPQIVDAFTFTELITGIPTSVAHDEDAQPAPATEAIPVLSPQLRSEDEDDSVVDDVIDDAEEDPRLAAMRTSLSSAASRFFDGPAPDYPYGDVPTPPSADEQPTADAESADGEQPDDAEQAEAEQAEGEQHRD